MIHCFADTYNPKLQDKVVASIRGIVLESGWELECALQLFAPAGQQITVMHVDI